MVCSGAYPEGPRCPMLSTVESVLDALSGAAPAVGAPSRTTSINMTNERTIVTLDRCIIFPSRRICPYRRGAACFPASRAGSRLPSLAPVPTTSRLANDPAHVSETRYPHGQHGQRKQRGPERQSARIGHLLRPGRGGRGGGRRGACRGRGGAGRGSRNGRRRRAEEGVEHRVVYV